MFGVRTVEVRKVPTRAFALSLALHCLVLALLLIRPEPRLLQPESSLRGDGGGGHKSVALVAPGLSAPPSPKSAQLRDDKTIFSRKPKSHPTPAAKSAASEQALKPGMPGFILGSLASGIPSDHDVKIALPIVAPDPPITRNKLPDWLRGDVVVEVTIDERGNVTKTVVLKSVGFGLEDLIVQTLQNWRFTPAMIDGVAVASRQDVHFHFPS